MCDLKLSKEFLRDKTKSIILKTKKNDKLYLIKINKVSSVRMNEKIVVFLLYLWFPLLCKSF